MATSTTSSSLAVKVDETDKFFCSLVDMVPKEIYLMGNVISALHPLERKYFKHVKKEKMSQKGKQGKNNGTEGSEEDIYDVDIPKSKSQNKRNKFSAKNLDTTITDIQLEHAEKFKKTTQPDEQTPVEILQVDPKEATIEALRKKIKEKLEMVRKNKMNQEKKADSETKSKQKKRKERSIASENHDIDEFSGDSEEESPQNGGRGQHLKKKTKINGTNTSELPEVDMDLQFGDIKLETKQNQKIGKPGSKVRTLKKLLHEAEKKENRLKELKNSLDSKEEVAKELWDSAIKNASGEIVKDNPKLLKKSLKRIERKKDKSTKQWNDRETTLKVQKQEKVEKRETNIQKRKNPFSVETTQETNTRPGFEGKKREFLNQEKGKKGKPQQQQQASTQQQQKKNKH